MPQQLEAGIKHLWHSWTTINVNTKIKNIANHLPVYYNELTFSTKYLRCKIHFLSKSIMAIPKSFFMANISKGFSKCINFWIYELAKIHFQLDACPVTNIYLHCTVGVMSSVSPWWPNHAVKHATHKIPCQWQGQGCLYSAKMMGI